MVPCEGNVADESDSDLRLTRAVRISSQSSTPMNDWHGGQVCTRSVSED